MTVSHILAVLSSSDLVMSVEVVEMNIEPTVQSLRAKATSKNGYVLYVERISGSETEPTRSLDGVCRVPASELAA